MPNDQQHPAATDAPGQHARKKLPDLVLLTADITIPADGRNWKRGTVIDDPEVIAVLFAAGGPGFKFFEEMQ